MSTLIITIVAIASVIAAASVICAGVFWAYCLKVERSWKLEVPLVNTERWRIESVRKRWALAGMVGYVLSMALAMLLSHTLEYSPANLYIIGATSLALMAISMRATIHNSRCFENDLKNRYPSFRM